MFDGRLITSLNSKLIQNIEFGIFFVLFPCSLLLCSVCMDVG
jgi:hypothetical protein